MTPETTESGTDRKPVDRVIVYASLSGLLLTQLGYMGQTRAALLALALGVYAIGIWSVDLTKSIRRWLA